jgi:hypothetical protein
MARFTQAALLFLIPILHAQTEKPLLLSTLREIRETAASLDQPAIAASAQWLENRAQTWNPQKPGEGLPLLASLGRILQALRAPSPALDAIADNLAIKVEHCRQTGLVAPQHVAVVTKRNGLDEVKGLSVLYLEKFFQNDPSAKPQEFRGISSPAVDDLVPGRYIIWAKETTAAGRTGPRKEVRIGAGVPKDPIEVLAP